MIKKMQYRTQKSLYQIGTQNFCNYDLDEILDNPKLDFFIGENKEIYYNDIKRNGIFDSYVDRGKIIHFNNDKPKEIKSLVRVDESTRREILSKADIPRKDRSKKLSCYYCNVTDSRGWIKFKTTSQYTKGLYYIQYVKLKEAKDMKYFKEFSKRDIIRLFLSGDLQVYCSCNDFKYRMKYMAYHRGYGLFKEMRYPKIRNPHLQGTVCKHLLCVLTYINANTMRIYKDMVKSRFFKKKAEIDDENS